MIKKIILVIKKLIVAILFIYTYNIFVFPLCITLPSNLFSIIIVSFFGLPAVIALCLFSIFFV